ADEIPDLAPKAGDQLLRRAKRHDLLAWMVAEVEGRQVHRGELGFGMTRTEINGDALKLAGDDSIHHLSHLAVMAALDELGLPEAPNKMDELGASQDQVIRLFSFLEDR